MAAAARLTNGEVRGVTSRGIFIALGDEIVLFLSREHFAGPLIVNIKWSAILEKIAVNLKVKAAKNGLVIPFLKLAVDWTEAEGWSALDYWPVIPLPPPAPLPGRNQIAGFLSKLQPLADSPNDLIGSVLAIIQPSAHPVPESLFDFYLIINHLWQALHIKDVPAIVSAAFPLAGRGRGLTPSGDDFILGLVYGMFRLQNCLPTPFLSAAAELASLVKNRSTLISANLVTCASQGEVDERLGAIFETLLHPEQPDAAAVHDILGWGSSSGLDATAGMALLVSFIQ